MTTEIQKSGTRLATAGIAGIVFFWLTDPVYGIGQKKFDNPMDAFNEAFLGTVVGVVGSAAALLIGMWFMTRRQA